MSCCSVGRTRLFRRLFPQVLHGQHLCAWVLLSVLRETFGAVALGGSPELTTLGMTRGPGPCGLASWGTLRDVAEANDTQISPSLRCEEIKLRGSFICGISSDAQAQAVCFVTVLRWNYFRVWYVWVTAMGKLGLSQEGNLVCVSAGVEGPLSLSWSLRCCECDSNGGPGCSDGECPEHRHPGLAMAWMSAHRGLHWGSCSGNTAVEEELCSRLRPRALI